MPKKVLTAIADFDASMKSMATMSRKPSQDCPSSIPGGTMGNEEREEPFQIYPNQ
jgi:hypothetical protein